MQLGCFLFASNVTILTIYVVLSWSSVVLECVTFELSSVSLFSVLFVVVLFVFVSFLAVAFLSVVSVEFDTFLRGWSMIMTPGFSFSSSVIVC